MIDEDIDLGRFFEIASSDKIYVIGFILDEIKKNSEDYTGDFELNGLMVTGTVEYKTNIRFKNMDDFENILTL